MGAWSLVHRVPVRALVVLATCAAALAGGLTGAGRSAAGPATARPAATDRSPVDLVLTPDGRYLLTANQTADSVSVVDLEAGSVVAEVPCGQRPSAVALTPDGGTAIVTGTYGGDVRFFRRTGSELTATGR